MEYASNPVLTSILVDELYEKSGTIKPTARGTTMRYSSAFGCLRQQGYAGMDYEPTEPMDASGAWVTGLGTIIHEHLQEAIGRKFPSAQFEVSSKIGDISGSCDALISTHDVGSYFGGTHVLYELKTMGTFSFDKQVGWNRMRGNRSDKGPGGPAIKAVAQAGINALGIETENPEIRIETLIMGSIAFEALSKNKAENMGVDGANRFLAEFYVSRDEWEPIAVSEVGRIQSAADVLKSGNLPERFAVDDECQFIELNPRGRFWQCDYCSFRSQCDSDGAGQVPINKID